MWFPLMSWVGGGGVGRGHHNHLDVSRSPEASNRPHVDLRSRPSRRLWRASHPARRSPTGGGRSAGTRGRTPRQRFQIALAVPSRDSLHLLTCNHSGSSLDHLLTPDSLQHPYCLYPSQLAPHISWDRYKYSDSDTHPCNLVTLRSIFRLAPLIALLGRIAGNLPLKVTRLHCQLLDRYCSYSAFGS